MTRRLLALTALVVALVCPAAASADWLPIEEVGTIGPSDQQFHTAANDRGDAILAWGDGAAIKVAVSRRGEAFGAARTVPGSTGELKLLEGVDLNEDGRAILWWREPVQGSGIRFKLVGLKVDGGFGRSRVVTPTDEYLSFEPVIGPGGR
ncbi:MAG: hypothetical protein M3340_04755, partial [Actinomycetota bacterium]|nr:hypothetical protein [Actinomycetota bacterium]